MTADRTTVGDRMLIHMSIYKRGFDVYNMPSILTQDGIADVLGLSRAHVSIELKKLLDKGFAKCDLAHVTGYESKKKVYTLTEKGFVAAEEAKERIGCGISIEEIVSRKRKNDGSMDEAFRLVLKSALRLSRIRAETGPFSHYKTVFYHQV